MKVSLDLIKKNIYIKTEYIDNPLVLTIDQLEEINVKVNEALDDFGEMNYQESDSYDQWHDMELTK